jgi:hypothetical protein
MRHKPVKNIQLALKLQLLFLKESIRPGGRRGILRATILIY